MSYLVLARKHRPQILDEVIGQEHITGLLAKAIESGRLSHAYLFCGPRGIGKTSCARILAKSLNCELGPTLKPCGTCAACREITSGTSFDVLEIDGASNRGIDEIRALRENVKFAPASGRYKIYIVDEVHMLTTEAFNALLKTLEEPPPHVKFIFATTAPHKVPATIISRCQKFDFKRISLKATVEALAAVSKKENFKIDEDALYAIAKSAQGSLRDALSVLDQLSALSEEGIGARDVSSMLGLVETALLFELTDALGRKDCAGSLEILEKIIDQGKDVQQLARDLIGHFRDLLIIKIGGKALERLVDHPASVKEMFLTQGRQFALKDILAAIDVLINAQEASRITESMRMSLEVAFAKLTYSGEAAASGEPRRTAPLSPVEPSPVRGPQTPASAPPQSAAPAKTPVRTGTDDEEPLDEINENISQDPPSAEAPTLEKIKRLWDTLTHALSREKMSVATYLQEGAPVEYKQGRLVVAFPTKCAFQKEVLEEDGNRRLVEKIFTERLGAPVVLCYDIAEDYQPKEEEAVVQEALKTFGGKVVNRWHEDA